MDGELTKIFLSLSPFNKRQIRFLRGECSTAGHLALRFSKSEILGMISANGEAIHKQLEEDKQVYVQALNSAPLVEDCEVAAVVIDIIADHCSCLAAVRIDFDDKVWAKVVIAEMQKNIESNSELPLYLADFDYGALKTHSLIAVDRVWSNLPVSYYQLSDSLQYWCELHSLQILKPFIALFFDVRGDSSLGPLQPPTCSTLRLGDDIDTALVHADFQLKDASGRRYIGKMTFVLKAKTREEYDELWKKAMREIVEKHAIYFCYGYPRIGGYNTVGLFDRTEIETEESSYTEAVDTGLNFLLDC